MNSEMKDISTTDPVNETAPVGSLAGADVKPLTNPLGSTPTDPSSDLAITDMATEDEEEPVPDIPAQDKEDVDAAQKAYQDFVAADPTRKPNVILAPSKEDQALNAGMNVVGRSGFYIPNAETQAKGFYVDDPGRLVSQHRQYKHFVAKGEDVPSVKID